MGLFAQDTHITLTPTGTQLSQQQEAPAHSKRKLKKKHKKKRKQKKKGNNSIDSPDGANTALLAQHSSLAQLPLTPNRYSFDHKEKLGKSSEGWTRKSKSHSKRSRTPGEHKSQDSRKVKKFKDSKAKSVSLKLFAVNTNSQSQIHNFTNDNHANRQARTPNPKASQQRSKQKSLNSTELQNHNKDQKLFSTKAGSVPHEDHGSSANKKEQKQIFQAQGESSTPSNMSLGFLNRMKEWISPSKQKNKKQGGHSKTPAASSEQTNAVNHALSPKSRTVGKVQAAQTTPLYHQMDDIGRPSTHNAFKTAGPSGAKRPTPKRPPLFRSSLPGLVTSPAVGINHSQGNFLDDRSNFSNQWFNTRGSANSLVEKRRSGLQGALQVETTARVSGDRYGSQEQRIQPSDDNYSGDQRNDDLKIIENSATLQREVSILRAKNSSSENKISKLQAKVEEIESQNKKLQVENQSLAQNQIPKFLPKPLKKLLSWSKHSLKPILDNTSKEKAAVLEALKQALRVCESCTGTDAVDPTELDPPLYRALSREENLLVSERMAMDDDFEVGWHGVKAVHLQCIEPGTWLNSDVINSWCNRLQAAVSEPSWQGLNVHIWHNFWWDKLDREGHRAMKRWTRKLNIFEKDRMIFPMNANNTHWYAGMVNFSTQTIHIYDSLCQSKNSHKREFQKIRQYLEEEAAAKGVSFNAGDWKYDCPVESTPQQQNGSDCGVFTCAFVWCCMHNLEKEMPFGQSTMKKLRRFIAFKVIDGFVIPEPQEGSDSDDDLVCLD